MNLVSFESLLNLLLDNANISTFSKVDKMHLLVYLVTYYSGKRNAMERNTGRQENIAQCFFIDCSDCTINIYLSLKASFHVYLYKIN